MRVPRLLVVATLSAVALATAGSAQAVTSPQPRAVSVPPAFSDGSFESPTAPAGTFVTYSAGQKIGPWTVTSGSVDLMGSDTFAAAEGDQSLDLDGNSPGAISQTFATTPGTTYTVSYSLAGNPNAGPAVKTGSILVDGQDVQDFSFDITGKTGVDMGYVNQQFTFLATKPSTTLAFVSTTPGPWGPVLDNIQVTPTCCKPACSV